MSIKSDRWIKRMCDPSLEFPMISPFEPKQVRVGVISYGVSSHGYDIRLADTFRIFNNVNVSLVDPKAFDERTFVERQGDYCIIPPNSFVLSKSMEWFNMPRRIIALCLGKSTYARCSLVVNVTPLESEWRGVLTIEISNTCTIPVKVYAHEGIAQLLFLESDEDCDVSYADRAGKYQNQQGITLPKV